MKKSQHDRHKAFAAHQRFRQKAIVFCISEARDLFTGKLTYYRVHDGAGRDRDHPDFMKP